MSNCKVHVYHACISVIVFLCNCPVSVIFQSVILSISQVYYHSQCNDMIFTGPYNLIEFAQAFVDKQTACLNKS